MPITWARADRSSATSRQRQSTGISLGLARQRGLQPGDLLRVAVRMIRVDLEPALAVVAAGVGVPAEAPPVRLGHEVEELGRGLARGAEREQRRLDGALVVVELPRPLVLVVGLDHRVGLGKELPQPRGTL